MYIMFVVLSVHPFVTTMNSGKMADSLNVPFGALGRLGPRNYVFDRGPDHRHKKGKLERMGCHSVTYAENLALWCGCTSVAYQWLSD